MATFWGICSTCLISPWFWRGIKEKNLFSEDGKKIGFKKSLLKLEVLNEIFAFVIVFLISLFLYTVLEARPNLYGSYPIIIICILSQCRWIRLNKGNVLMVFTSILLTLNLLIQDYQAVSLIDRNTLHPVSSKDNIVQWKIFNAYQNLNAASNFSNFLDYASVAEYNNGVWIYTVSNDSHEFLGIIYCLDEPGGFTNPKFRECDYYPYDITIVKNQYPTYEIRYETIAINDIESTPFSVFSLYDKTNILGSYEKKKYVLMNLVTGDLQEFSIDELPEFVVAKEIQM